MSTKADHERTTLLQGTLDLLILRTLARGPEHGHGITRAILQSSGDVLLVDHGSLYPALQRLEARALITAEWGVSPNGRRARYYELTPRGKKELRAEADRWQVLVSAVARVLGPSYATG
jgi:transcriptional regulator